MTKSTRRALLSSVVALVLCLTMLIGTTFAWFTDTASTAVNTIQSGTLKIALEDTTGNSLEGKSLSWKKAEDAPEDEEILWEPGCTYELEDVVIKNDGNLALKYVVAISGINGDAKLNEAITWTIEVDGEDYLLPGEKATLTISGHMEEDAGNEYQGLSIDGAAITVYATQYTHEYDSNNNTYDENATLPSIWDGETTEATTTVDQDGVYHITSASEFVYYITTALNGLNSGHDYVLDCDIDLGGRTITFSDGNSRVLGSNFDGQNHTISNFTLTGNVSFVSLFGYTSPDRADRTVKNVTVKNATVIGTKQVAVILSAANTANGAYTVTVDNCKVYDSTVIGNKKVAPVVAYTEGGTITNCYAENCNVYCADSKTDQAGEVVGYINVSDGLIDNTSKNTSENVTVVFNAKPVSTADELAAALDNAGNAPSYDRIVVLTDDIDGSDWTAIPGGSNYPAVEIYGNGHTIKNLAQPLFSSLPGRDYVFDSINFTDVDITTSANAGLAAIVGEGMADGGGSYTITNCHINGGTIDGGSTYYVGGFIGFKSNGCNAIFTDCSVTNLTLKTSEESVGAFAGHLYGTVTLTNCSVKGNTYVANTADRSGDAAKAGAFVGTAYNDVNATNCSVDENVTVYNKNAEPINDGWFGRHFVGTITIN